MITIRQTKVIGIIALVAIFFTFVIGAVMVVAHPSFDKADYDIISYSVRSGDSLWSLAQTYKVADDATNEWIYEVANLNNLDSSDLYTSQPLLLYCARS